MRLLINMNEFFSVFQPRLQHFKSTGYIELYKIIFGTPQFPYWFTLQAIWSCYVVHRSTKHHKKTFSLWLRNLLISAAMSYAPRELFAYLFHKHSPITNNPQMSLVFLGIYLSISLCPQNIVYKILTVLYYFIGFLQGANQTRFFTLIVRVQKEISPFYLILIAMLFTIMDQLIELVFRPILDGDETKMSNFSTMARTCLFSIIFYLSTYQNYLTKFIGKYNIHVTALVLAFTLGLFNASAILNFDSQERVPRPPPTPKLSRKSPKRSGNVSDCEY